MNNMESANAAIQSALDGLQRHRIDFTEELTPVTQLIWSLLVQWFVRHFCKKLIQLMTPEALVLHGKQIPSSYIHCYLSYQKHFSLKDLIQQQLMQRNRYEQIITKATPTHINFIVDSVGIEHNIIMLIQKNLSKSLEISKTASNKPL